ncbi:uncharacterized protein LOC123672095 [Harmonia axyridis]|uniref:uncharacterized protein LOC123672095 n=1 Tax=Harmonia axyridis TaxID=115357 RepID=UPI001E276E70|nr:uncharacterized protein LOC123672095 [Harmonia axyridis]
MKVIILCFVLIAVFYSASAKPVDDLDGKWEKFKVDFKKNYGDSEEESTRKELFRKTVEQVEAHNARYEKGLETYTQGINHFADLTPEEKKQYLGFRPSNSAAAPVQDVDSQWVKYKADFNKKYDSPEEEAQRKQLFVKTLQEVESHNAKYQQGLVTWTKGINQFADWTPEEFKRIQGTRLSSCRLLVKLKKLHTMNIACLCLVLLAVLHLGSSNPVDDLDAKWAKYKVDFNKKYVDPTEDARRKEIFKQSLIDIEEHNAKYKQGLVSWYKGINQFTDITKEEFAAMQGHREVSG